MKKAFSLLAVLMFIFAAGCENSPEAQQAPPPVPTAFSSDISISYGNIEMTALFTQNAADDFKIDFLTPEALSPLSLIYQKGTCTVQYDGLTFDADFNRFPQTEMGTLLTDAISDIVQGFEVQTMYSEGIWTYKGTGERGSFTLTRNAETGAFLEFRSDGAQLHIVFSNFIAK